MGAVELSSPTIPYVANLTGEWVDGAATDRQRRGAGQLRSTVRFSRRSRHDPATQAGPAGDEPSAAGSGPWSHAWSPSRRKQVGNGDVTAAWTLPSLPGPDDDRADTAVAHGSTRSASGQAGRARRLGRIRGRPSCRRRVSLPTYPFERRELLGRRNADGAQASRQTSGPRVDWFYRPTWKEAPLSVDGRSAARRAAHPRLRRGNRSRRGGRRPASSPRRPGRSSSASGDCVRAGQSTTS